MVKRTGDGALVEFRSVVDAVRCAIEVQNGMVKRNAGVPPERRIDFRIGIHLGDIVEENDGDLMGDGVNIAARLEGTAEPSGICLSNAAYEQVRDKLKESFVDLGDQALKNIARPIRVYRLDFAPKTTSGSVATQPLPALPDKPSIAVLPFQNLSDDPEQEYFTDGMVEDIITGLSVLSGSLSSPAIPASPTRVNRRTSARWDESSVCVTYWKAVCVRRATASGLPDN